MDQAGARLKGDVWAADDGDVTLLEGMLEQNMFERRAFCRADDLSLIHI